MINKNSPIDYLPETFEKVRLQLENDQKHWGDIWKHRPAEGQEIHAFTRFLDYLDQYKNAGVPIPWEKIIAEAHICMVRIAHPEVVDA